MSSVRGVLRQRGSQTGRQRSTHSHGSCLAYGNVCIAHTYELKGTAKHAFLVLELSDFQLGSLARVGVWAGEGEKERCELAGPSGEARTATTHSNVDAKH